MQRILAFVFIVALVWACAVTAGAAPADPDAQAGVKGKGPGRLVVVWSSGDPEVAENVCLMYTHAAAKYDWFDAVTLVVWGPSADLLAGSPQLQAKVRAMQEDGVRARACVVCAENYGVAGDLRGLGLEVKSMGRPLTRYLKDRDVRVLTF